MCTIRSVWFKITKTMEEGADKILVSANAKTMISVHFIQTQSH